ncbi:MAG: cytochrome c [Verrucomicrobiae bacterium]|nr:cytochrome c [Verrucomicrobiae bacterium]
MDPAEDKNLDYQQGTISTVELHDAIRRETPLHPGERGGVGITVIVLSSIILIFGGGHFGSSLTVAENYIPAPRPSLDGSEAGAAQVVWIDKWMGEGKKVYNNCIACHQASGLGIPGQFPPLVGSEWVDGGTKRLGAILLHGINGPFKVGGQTYNQLMPAWNNLNDEKIAQVLTYVRRNFGSLPEGEDGVVTTEMIKAAREEFNAHTAPFTEAELLAIPGDAQLSGAKVNLETGEPL